MTHLKKATAEFYFLFDCCLLGGGERVLNDFSQRLPLTRHGKQSIVGLKI